MEKTLTASLNYIIIDSTNNAKAANLISNATQKNCNINTYLDQPSVINHRDDNTLPLFHLKYSNTSR